MCYLYEHELSDGEVEHLLEHRELIGKNWAEATKVYSRQIER
jgi:hypothetical protein